MLLAVSFVEQSRVGQQSRHERHPSHPWNPQVEISTVLRPTDRDELAGKDSDSQTEKHPLYLVLDAPTLRER